VAVERWVVSPSDPDPLVLARAASALREGGVIVFPTDTFYGLAADPRNPTAVEAVFRVKGREPAEPLPLVAADTMQAEREAAVMTPLARRLAKRFWPGPLTLVVGARASLAPAVTAGTGTVAIRVPDHNVARRLAELAGFPLTSTSANRSGFPPAATAAEAVGGLGQGLAAVLDAGVTPGGPPSTIVDARGDAPRLVRAGAIAWERVVEALRTVDR
jgi:L-threonylcarbamoyladenylate synthase